MADVGDFVSTMQYAGRAVINGEEMPCEIMIEQQIMRERTRLPRQDTAWTLVDRAGHFHAVDEDGDYPTLDERTEHRDCEGTWRHTAIEEAYIGPCEGYDVTLYACSICGEDIKPGVVEGEHEFTVPGLKSWQAKVNGYLPPRQKLSLRFESQRASFFGVAMVTSMSMGDMAGPQVTELVGVGKLGQLKPR